MLPILCASVLLKETLSLTGLIVLLVLRLVHMFDTKKATQYGFCPLFARPFYFFYEGACSFAPIIFKGLFI